MTSFSDQERWEQVRHLFGQAQDLSPRERLEFLRKECGDEDVLREILSLLKAAENPHPVFLNRSASNSLEQQEADDETPEENLKGRRIGPYVLQRLLGAGGMGTVYLAQRAEGGFDQTVALKLLPLGLNSGAILRRFDEERTILAQLEHPNIARLYDGGVTEDRVPFFTMEYIDGVPIDKYCNEKTLAIKDRLRLFESVCRAVQHAQENLIVHRDLKPSNILVNKEGEVKLLDFGIARALDSVGSTSVSEITSAGIKLLTPAYASPEQIRGEPVTTATDVYSLGILLYELLSGRKPYEMDSSNIGDIERVVSRTVPKTPSTVVIQKTGDSIETSAQQLATQRAATPESLKRQLRGELDLICMKALRKDPAERYRSAAQLVADLERFRRKLPILARPISKRYRALKYTSRNRVPLAITAVVLLTALGAFYYHATNLKQERDIARAERQKSDRVVAMLLETFQVVDPSESRGESVTARELLERGAQKLEKELADEPKIWADLSIVIGTVYRNLGLYHRSESILRETVKRVGLSAPNQIPAARAWTELGNTLLVLGRHVEAESLLALAESTYQERAGEDGELAQILDAHGYAFHNLGRYQDAQEAFERAAEIWKQLDLSHSVHALTSGNNLALLYVDLSRPDEAKTRFESVIADFREFVGDDHPEYATAMYNYADLLRSLGDRNGARQALSEVVALEERLYGSTHPMLGFDHLSLANLEFEEGHYEQARDSYAKSLDIFQNADSLHAQVPVALSYLGRTAEHMLEYTKADSLFRLSLRLHEKIDGPEHPYIAIRLNDIGRLQRLVGNGTGSIKTLREALQRNEKTWGKQHSQIAQTCYLLAHSLSEGGAYDEAIAMSKRGLEIEQNSSADTNSKVLMQQRGLADVYLAAKKLTLADSLYELALTGYRKLYGDDDLQVAHVLYGQARVQVEMGAAQDAIELVDRALAVVRARISSPSRLQNQLLELSSVIRKKFDGISEASRNESARSAQSSK